MKVKIRMGLLASLLGGAVVLSLAFQNCAAPVNNGSVGVDPSSVGKKVSASELKDLYLQIESLSRLDLRCQTNEDCGALALGSKSCGGPQKHIVVSSQNVYLNEVSSLAHRLAESEREFNIDNNVISNCSVEIEPQVSCVESICQVSSGE